MWKVWEEQEAEEEEEEVRGEVDLALEEGREAEAVLCKAGPI